MVFEKKNVVKIRGKNYEVDQYGLKDKKGRIVVPAKFDNLDDFYSRYSVKGQDYVAACKATTWKTVFDFASYETLKCGLIDVDGNYVAPPDFDKILIASKDLAVFWIGCDSWRECGNAKQGIYSIAQKKIVVNPRFDSIQISGDLIAVKADGKYGYIDISGKYVIEPKFSQVSAFRDGLAKVDFPESYIDSTGK